MSSDRNAQRSSYVGPHEGREFDLMRSGEKHLAVFVLEDGFSLERYPDSRFEQAVKNGDLVKSAFTTSTELADGSKISAYTVMYAHPEEEWRISAFQLVNEIYRRKSPGWRPDLERVIGALLGYSDADVEAFIDRLFRLNNHIAEHL